MRLVITVVVGLLLCGEGRAQSPKAAGEAFDKGRALMEAKRYAEACAAFELSQRLDPQYGTQFNLAGCCAALDKLATAWKLYRELARADPNPQRRAYSAELARQLATRVSKLRLRVAPQLEGLQVFVGSTDVTSMIGADIPFDLGHYIVEARLPGHRPFREEIDIELGGEVQELEIALERESKPADHAKPGRGTPALGRERFSRISVGGGAVLGGFGLLAGWRAFANRDVAQARCNLASCPDRAGAQATIDRARLWGNLSTATLAIGIAGIASGIYLWHTSSSQRLRVAPVVSPASASVALSGAF